MPEHDDTARVLPQERRSGALGTLAGVLAGVLVFLLIVLGVLVLGGNEDVLDPEQLAVTPVTPEEAERSPTPSPTSTPTPTMTPTPTPEEREPTDADAAAFASAYQPPGAQNVESVTVDVTGDGSPEIVVTSVANGVTRVDVARWNGDAYEVVFTDQGGEAEEVRFTVTDLTGDGVREIVTVQRIGQDGESLSLWGWDGEDFTRQRAQGGCWDGSHTYGIVGVLFRVGEIVATCDESPQPIPTWGSDAYVWDGEAWTHDEEAST